MDLYAKKILGFLQSNPNLDLEAADIAFHLKMDEQFVQNYMSSLLRQGLVINRRNEYGRIYWYAQTREAVEADIPVMEPSPVSVAKPTEQTQSDKGKDDFDEFIEKEDKKVPILKTLFFVALIAAFGALVYLGMESMNRKINAVAGIANTVNKEAVLNAEYSQFKNESSLMIKKLESDIKELTVLVDSLKTVLYENEKNKAEDMKSRKNNKKRK